MKTTLIVIALAGLAVLFVLGSPEAELDVADLAATSGRPAFEVRVIKPRMARPLFGLLPTEPLGLPPNELRFDHTSPGAEVVEVASDRLALRADDWELLLEFDARGGVGPGTRLTFSLELAEREWTLCCRPDDDADASLRLTEHADRDTLDGRFEVELAACEDAATGEPVAWPPRALTVRGRFAGVPAPPPR